MKYPVHSIHPRFYPETIVTAVTRATLVAGLLWMSAPLSAQSGVEYPDPFIGGYPDLENTTIYMEWYYPPPVTASPTYPAWAPDGSSLAFAAHGRIWTVPVEGGTARQLTDGPGYHSQPHWSPDGRYLAYTGDVDHNIDIYVMNVETGEQRRITENPHLDLRPRWSPDGSRVLLTTSRSGWFDLWAFNIETEELEPIVVNSNQNDMDGDWIGDSGDVVFVSKRGEAALGSGSLWRWIASTGQVERLVRVETNFQGWPSVAPHGGAVAYITDASGNNDWTRCRPKRRRDQPCPDPTGQMRFRLGRLTASISCMPATAAHPIGSGRSTRGWASPSTRSPAAEASHNGSASMATHGRSQWGTCKST